MSPLLPKEIAAAAVGYGQYELSSGKVSTWYFDKYVLTTDPECLLSLALSMARHIPLHTDRLVGPELGSVPLMVAVALAMRKPYAIVRKQAKVYGNKKHVEGEIRAGERVVIIEDTITTGAQALRTASLVESYGAKVEMIVALFDREDGSAVERIEAAGYPVVCMLTKSMLGIEEA